MKEAISRRAFLKLGGLSATAISLRPPALRDLPWGVFPSSERLGRVTASKVDLKVRADKNSQTVGALYQDAVVPWLRERVGPHPQRVNQRWVETPEGYFHAPDLQPVRDFDIWGSSAPRQVEVQINPSLNSARISLSMRGL